MAHSVPSTERPSIEKLRACLVQIETALLLMIRGDNPIPIHTLLSASKGILIGLNTAIPNSVITKTDGAFKDLIKPGFEKEWFKYANRAANFFKHADLDPFDKLEGVEIETLNRIEAVICILAVWEYVKILPRTILTGLIFVSRNTHNFFDFHSYLNESDAGKRILEDIRKHPSHGQEKFLLNMFEIGLKSDDCASNISIPPFNKD